MRGGQRLVDVLHRQTRRLGELFLRGSRPSSTSRPACCARQLLLALDDMDRHADRARVIRDGALQPTGGSTTSHTSRT